MQKNKPFKTQRFEFDILFINQESKVPIFKQLETQLRESIWQNTLKPGERLPSTRVLAKQLNIARNTVINTYEQLIAEGLLISNKGDGTRIADNIENEKTPQKRQEQAALSPEAIINFSQRYNNHALPHKRALIENTSALPFRSQITDTTSFPFKTWARLTNQHLKSASSNWISQTESQGYQPLRSAISDYLGVIRGIQADHQDISITAGAQQGIELLVRLLINPGDYVVFEDPGYTSAMTVFEMYGAKIISIPVDEFGFNVELLSSLKVKIKMVYTTPISHFPLSVCLSQTRRKLLIQWAQNNNVLIIEDDYNGEYRYCGRPLSTLYEQCNSNHVIYMGSFSKLLFSGLRIGFLVTPRHLVEPLKKLRWLIDRHSPLLEQAVLTDFINDGHLSRHLRKMRVTYSLRQQFLLEAANTHLNHILNVPALEGGLHLIGWLQKGVQEKKLLNASKKANVELIPTSLYQRLPIEKPSVIMGFASYSEEQLLNSVLALKKSYDELT